jgi:YegS/Rv2252/BmrU family lipid kinase
VTSGNDSLPYLAVVNPAAGHGKCGKLAPTALDQLRRDGVPCDIVETRRAGEAVQIARTAYAEGRRKFIAVGGDGTSHEIINGLFPESLSGDLPTLGFLPLGTGNSFLRDFTTEGLQHARRALTDGRTRRCDLVALKHRAGTLYSINILSVGFVADAAVVANRRFKGLGELGYVLAVLACLVQLNRRAFPLRVDDDRDIDRRRCLLLTFNNSKFTGGKMMLAPMADTADGLVEYVRWGPIGRLGLLRNFRTLFDGTHINHPLASRRGARTITFFLDGPIDVMVDGEVVTVHCETIEAMPSVLNVVV